MNTTVNLAKRSGRFFFGITALLLLCMPLLGVWMEHMETTPVQITMTDTTLTALHTNVSYQLSLNNIAYLEYVETLPDTKRIVGTSMHSVLKGRYKTPWGSTNVCLDPRIEPYIYIETNDGKRYLFGSSNCTQTESIWTALCTQQEISP